MEEANEVSQNAYGTVCDANKALVYRHSDLRNICGSCVACGDCAEIHDPQIDKGKPKRRRKIIIMIRALQKADIDRVADLWLDTNLKAHDFIPAEYWKGNYDAVKEMLPQAEVYVYENDNDNKIRGFVGLNDEYIEGIFVADGMQSQGIGKRLLDFVKEKRMRLCLNVYQKNIRAIHFYQREGFEIRCEGLDEDNGEKDYEMIWQCVPEK